MLLIYTIRTDRVRIVTVMRKGIYMYLFRQLLMSILLVAPVISAADWYIGDKHASDTQWQKAKNGFGASLILTPNSTKLYDSWNQKQSSSIHR